MQTDQAVVGSTCLEESSTHLTLRPHTKVGPAFLGGVRVLVIFEYIPAILDGRDLLRAPGFDPHEKLRSKLSHRLTPPELDVSGIPSIF